MLKIKEIIIELRPYQWYKNTLIFLAIIFSRNILIIDHWVLLIFGFFSLCLISSSIYVCNDLIDKKRDVKNPEKAHRPIASGKMSLFLALFLISVCLLLGLLLAFILNPLFGVIGLLLFIISLIYSFYIKHILFADLIVIAFNFVLRAISGAVLIKVRISPWLIMGVFFLGLYLVTGKRYGEKSLLQESSEQFKPILLEYTQEMLLSLFTVFLSVLIVIYALFSFSSENQNLLWTTPLFLYLLLRYYYLILSGNQISRHFEKVITDKPLLIGGISLFILMIILII